MDESGIDDNEEYSYGWGKTGKRIYSLRMSYRTKRLSIISALNRNKLQAPFVFEGYCNSKVIELYIKKVLVPTLKPGQTVIMDNASFHKSEKVKFYIEEVGCNIIYLPPYSPDLNPIEHHWHAVKNKMRKKIKKYGLYKAAKYAFSNDST